MSAGPIAMSITRLREGKIILSLTILKTAQQGRHGDWPQAAAGPWALDGASPRLLLCALLSLQTRLEPSDLQT